MWAHSALRGPGPLRARGGTPDVASGAWAVWSVVSGGLHVHRYLDVASNVTQGADRGRSPRPQPGVARPAAGGLAAGPRSTADAFPAPTQPRDTQAVEASG